MPRGKRKLTATKLAEMRAIYEDPQREMTTREIAAHFGVTKQNLEYHARTKNWISKERITKEKDKIKRKVQSKIIEKKLDDWGERYEEARISVYEAAFDALERFKESGSTPKDFHEAIKAFEMLKDVCGKKEEKEKAKIQFNVGLLSTPTVDPDYENTVDV